MRQRDLYSWHFTLLELLVVVAIISILASMLLPALRTVREKAREIDCLNKQKQVAVNLNMYCSDNDSVYPLAMVNSYANGAKTWYGGDFGKEYLGLAQGGAYVSAPGSIILSPNNPAHCSQNPFQYTPALFLNYALHQNISRKANQIANPSMKICVIEAGMNERFSYWVAKVSSGFGWWEVSGVQPHRNGGGQNVIFVDAHVEDVDKNELDETKNFKGL